jgi:magnesium-transporting ATPase (P-type)
MGPNEPAPRRRGAALGALLAFLATPLLLILLVASAVSGFLGDIVNAVRIALMVVLRVLLNCLQAYRSQRAAERLRDAVWGEIARHDLVPGDVLRPTAGDQVPADAYLLETRDLHLQQATLTGESMPVEKDASARPPCHSHAPTPGTWCSWAPRWSAGRSSPWWSRPGLRPPLATVPHGGRPAPQKPSSSAVSGTWPS